MSQVVRTTGVSASDANSTKSTPSRYGIGDFVAEKYQLIGQLDEGGMGSLWVAKNIALDAPVALKLIRHDIAAEGAEERFLTEARAAARLRHPSIVRVFDFGRTPYNEPYIVMELLHGDNLGDILEREERLDASYVAQVLLPIADALAVAHSKGIVHRDLKPDNIFLSDADGQLHPKVLDFGIAKLSEGQLNERKITQAGTVVGSPDYMSPEQARGLDDIDHRADIWAFCVLFYECITGQVPFQDKNYNALLRHIIEKEVPSILDLGVGDADLWRILARGFAKDREQRYQGMRDIGRELANWLLTQGVSEDISGHSLRSWLEPGRASVPPGSLRPAPSASQPPASGSIRPGTPPEADELSATALFKPNYPGFSLILALVCVLFLGAAGFFSVSAWLGASRQQSTVVASPTAAPIPVRAPEPAIAPVEPPTVRAEDLPSEAPRKSKSPKPKLRLDTPAVSANIPPTPAATTSKPRAAYGEDFGF